MSILAFIPDPESAATVAEWTRALAQEDEVVEFLCLQSNFDDQSAQALATELGEEAAPPTWIEHPAPVSAILERTGKKRPRLLITARFSLPSVGGGDAQTSGELLRRAPCQVFAPIFGSKKPAETKRILFVFTNGTHDRAALGLVNALRERLQAEVTVGYIEDETGAQPGQFGEKIIHALLHELALDEAAFLKRVVVDVLKHRGITELCEGHDLVVTGYDAASFVEPLGESLGDATAVVVKRTPPLRPASIADVIPRINPGDLADLMLELRLGSKWSADFIAMLGLASAIASLGLIQDSPAVVIGSMLLAPLMTPMIGLGLALGQANRSLMQACGKSIGLGFLLTLIISLIIGSIMPAGETLTDEVLARSAPNILDLLIAVAAAAAATYAMARPNTSGAIAGVAIATALVPPVCAMGIALAHGSLPSGLGAASLFATNLVAIIVMSSFTFSFLGITPAKVLPSHRRLASVTRIGLLVFLVAIAAPLIGELAHQLERGKNVPIASPVTREVQAALDEHVAQEEGVEIVYLGRPRAEHRVAITIASEKALPSSYAGELTALVREAMNDSEVEVTVIAVQGMWRIDDQVAGEPE